MTERKKFSEMNKWKWMTKRNILISTRVAGSITASCLLVILVVVAGGCGSKTTSGTTSTSPAPSSSGRPGNYVTSFNGVDMVLHLSATTDATTAEIESYIAEVSAKVGVPVEPHTVAFLSLDDRGKTATHARMFSISLVNTDRSQVSSEGTSSYIDSLYEKLDVNNDTGLYNQGIDLSNKLSAQDDVLPGTKTSTYLIFKTADVSKVKSVFVSSRELPGTEEMKKQP